MNFGRTLKKALKRNDLHTDFETWGAIARDRPRCAAAYLLYAHAQPSDAQPSDAKPSDAQPSDAQPSDV